MLGFATTVTLTLLVELHPLSVTVILYVPLLAAAAFGILGFCVLSLKLFGPLQV